jgi:type I restriction enzyme S subunit
MIEGLKPYAEYKESGSKWLGSVPVKWEVRNLRTLISKRAERNRPELPLLSVAREKGVFVRSMTDLDENHNVIPEDLTNYKVARLGNLVINKMKAWQGSMGIAPCDGIVSPAYFVFDFRIANHAFGQRLLRSKPYVAHFGQASDGVRVGQWDLSIPGMRQIPVLVPPPAEQAAIVRFLDHANRKIDGFIRAKRKLIGLLNEQKQAIIHRAVTRGLNPDVPMKPSGIPWLGEIPGHWEVMRVKQCARKISKGTTPSTEDRAILESGPVRFLKAENISAGRITDKPLCFIDEETNHIIRRSQLAENDILFVIAGATLGKTAVVSVEVIPANTNQAVAFIRPNSRLIPCFLELWLQSPLIKELIWLNAVQSAQPNLSMADLGNFVTPVPTRNEQQQILDFVKDATNPMADAISRTEREIALMQEYRTRLTADLVTGKLDVREAAAKLPDPPVDAVAEPLTDDSLEESESEDADT